jgi:hypothetical protein
LRPRHCTFFNPRTAGPVWATAAAEPGRCRSCPAWTICQPGVGDPRREKPAVCGRDNGVVISADHQCWCAMPPRMGMLDQVEIAMSCQSNPKNPVRATASCRAAHEISGLLLGNGQAWPQPHMMSTAARVGARGWDGRPPFAEQPRPRGRTRPHPAALRRRHPARRRRCPPTTASSKERPGFRLRLPLDRRM